MVGAERIACIAAAVLVAGCAAPARVTTPTETAPLATTNAVAPVPTPEPEPIPLDATRQAETVSLLREPLFAPALSRSKQREFEQKLEAAQLSLDADPASEMAIIWVGRRLAYLGRYNDAIAAFTGGLKVHPNSYRLLRHRGHRFITLRRFFAAVTDLRRAAELIDGVPDEIEPDGLPNARNQPRSSTHSNIFYHLGLAHYLRGNHGRARDAYERCMEFATNDDMRCATAYWLYLTLRRLGSDGEASSVLESIHADMDIIENTGYHRLLLLFKGELTPAQVRKIAADSVDDATIGYGIGCWHQLAGRDEEASSAFQAVVAGESWPAFGHIAAEAELARTRQ